MRFQHKRWETPDTWYCFLRPFSSMRLLYPEPKSFPQFVLQPWLHTLWPNKIPFFLPSRDTAAVLFCCWMKQCFTGYGFLICRFWWQCCHRVPTISPCQSPVPPPATQHSGLSAGLEQLFPGAMLIRHWSSWSKMQNQKPNQNTYTKKKKAKSFLFHRVFCSQS